MFHKIVSKQRNSNLCFVCGLENDFGIHAHFYVTENQELIALFTPSEKHQSYPERMHGGIASAILDETIGRAILNKYETEVWGVTVEFNLKFKKPIPLNQQLKVIAELQLRTAECLKEQGKSFCQMVI